MNDDRAAAKVGTAAQDRAADTPRLIIFDFDGTLADSYPWFAAELAAVGRRWGFRPVAPAEEPWLRHCDAAAIFRHLQVPVWKTPLIAADLRRRMTRDIDRIRLFPGVAAMLGTLVDAGRELAILSSNSAANVEHVLGPKLRPLFRLQVCGVALGGKATRLRRLVRRAGVNPAQALYIGDELRDLVAARAAGVPAAAVAWGYNHPAALRRQAPAFLFNEVAEISARFGRTGPG